MAGTSAPSRPASTSAAPAAAAAAACATVVTGASNAIPGQLPHGSDITDRAWHDSYVPVLFLIAIVVVLVGIFFAATGRGGELSYEPADHAPLDLGPVSAADVALLRPPTAMWGYNMQVTDAALDQIARAVRDRDVTIAYLQDQLAGYERNGSYAEPRGGYARPRTRRPSTQPRPPAPAKFPRSSVLPGSSRPPIPTRLPTPWNRSEAAEFTGDPGRLPAPRRPGRLQPGIPRDLRARKTRTPSSPRKTRTPSSPRETRKLPVPRRPGRLPVSRGT